MAEWLIPFKGRNFSWAFTQNFVWRDKNVYIMDNHRAALWCWLQHVRDDQDIALFHIDRHTDTLYSNIDRWIEACPEVRSLGLDEYLNVQTPHELGDSPLFSWANYLSIFLEKYADNLMVSYFATHQDGDAPRLSSLINVAAWELPKSLGYWIEQTKLPAIVNIDLDYFVCDSSSDEHVRFMDNAYVREVFKHIADQLVADRVTVLTVCLSPEFCGGWNQAEELCEIACEELGLNFKIPKEVA